MSILSLKSHTRAYRRNAVHIHTPDLGVRGARPRAELDPNRDFTHRCDDDRAHSRRVPEHISLCFDEYIERRHGRDGYRHRFQWKYSFGGINCRRRRSSSTNSGDRNECRDDSSQHRHRGGEHDWEYHDIWT
jgi:hypothetical protein